MSQSINLGNVTEANFNGSTVEQINLNGTGIWTKILHAMTPVNASAVNPTPTFYRLSPQVYCDSNNNAYVRNWSGLYLGANFTLTVTSATTSRGGLVTSTVPFIDYDTATGNLRNTGTISWRYNTADSYGNWFIVNQTASTLNNTISFVHHGSSQIAGTNHYTASITWNPSTSTFGALSVTTISVNQWNRTPDWSLPTGFTLT